MNNREHSHSHVKWLQREFAGAMEYAAEYDAENTVAHFYNSRLRRVSELLADFSCGKVLDVGCGPGIVSKTFLKKPIEYYGVDVSEEMIKVCIERHRDDPARHFFQGRIEELPFRDSCFDVVLCLGAFEYVFDGNIAIDEILRVLDPRGILIITMLNKSSPYLTWEDKIYWKLKNLERRLIGLAGIGKNRRRGNAPKRKCFTLRLHKERALRSMLTSKGMMILDIVYYNFNLFLLPLDAWFPKAAVCFSKKLECLCRSMLKSLGTGYIVKCRKCVACGLMGPER